MMERRRNWQSGKKSRVRSKGRGTLRDLPNSDRDRVKFKSSTVVSNCECNTSTRLYSQTASNILLYAKLEVRMTREMVPPFVKAASSKVP